MISKERLAQVCRWFKRKSFVICCGIAPVILLSALLLTCDFGCNVIVNGEVIGTAPSEEYVSNLVDSINEELSPYLGGSKAIAVEPVTTPKLVFGKGFTDSQRLGEKLKSYCPYLEKAFTVKSGGKTVAAFRTSDERKETYNNFVKEMAAGSSSYKILDKIDFAYELVPYGLVKTGDAASKMLERTYEFDGSIDVDQDCSIEDILTSYNISEEKFVSLNPKYKEGTKATVAIKSDIPYIRVVTENSFIENTIVNYTVKYETDDTMYQGESQVKIAGEDGFKKEKKTKVTVNGQCVYQNSSPIENEDATTEVILVGTKESPKGKASGSISKPCSGVLTSRFGSRNGRQHKGIDISAKENSDITAADGGTVIFAGWDDSGYGNMVKIDHGNGYTTIYAHCNALYVSEGTKVSQGDVIAALGNTGRSTGPHVHFEVIETQTGTPIDPLRFFNLQQ